MIPNRKGLTASDRPYKKAVPLEKAMKNLDYEVKDNHIDGILVRELAVRGTQPQDPHSDGKGECQGTK